MHKAIWKGATCLNCGGRPVEAKGLCNRCYCKEWRKNHPTHRRSWGRERPGYRVYFQHREVRKRNPDHFGIHFCAVCGDTLHKKTWKNKYCSKACERINRNKKRQVARRKAHPERFGYINCKNCKTKFEKRSWNQKYCRCCSPWITKFKKYDKRKVTVNV